jgi:predicted NAD/FAD-binding protein
MKIAIVGSGISGLTCAYLLSGQHEVDVFEASDYIGGHTHTVETKVASGTYGIDTGFIVFNDWTYPNFIKLMTQAGVKWKDSSMSFSVKTEAGAIEYNGTSLNTLFAQRFNLFKPGFHRMIRDILRFNQESLQVLENDSKETLGEYLIAHGYSKQFKDHYIVPMGAAIWSSSVKQMDLFPIAYFVRFFKNHGMLSVNHRPTWKVIQGGSSAYIEPLIAKFKDRVHLKSRVAKVLRRADGVTLIIEGDDGIREANYDEVIFACHSDQALCSLHDASMLEEEILESFSYQPNSTILHTDVSVLPKKKLAWAAWNYFVPKAEQNQVAVTYHMNILQGIQSPETFCVSLNLDDQIDPTKILKKFVYHHPVFSRAAFDAQTRWKEISGKNRTHFCGAYWGYGFHEDGVKSALKVCESLGVHL